MLDFLLPTPYFRTLGDAKERQFPVGVIASGTRIVAASAFPSTEGGLDPIALLSADVKQCSPVTATTKEVLVIAGFGFCPVRPSVDVEVVLGSVQSIIYGSISILSALKIQAQFPQANERLLPQREVVRCEVGPMEPENIVIDDNAIDFQLVERACPLLVDDVKLSYLRTGATVPSISRCTRVQDIRSGILSPPTDALEIGSGASGHVFAAVLSTKDSSGVAHFKPVAVKIVRCQQGLRRSAVRRHFEYLMREAAMLSTIRSSQLCPTSASNVIGSKCLVGLEGIVASSKEEFQTASSCVAMVLPLCALSTLQNLVAHRMKHCSAVTTSLAVTSKSSPFQQSARCSQKQSVTIPEPLLTEHEFAAILSSICRGLHFLHSTLKKLHRDIKPDNILLNEEMCERCSAATGAKGRCSGCSIVSVKLGDFGISVERSSALTSCGTPKYMAPEVMCAGALLTDTGARKGYDCAADIFSLGVTMQHALSGGNQQALRKQWVCALASAPNTSAAGSGTATGATSFLVPPSWLCCHAGSKGASTICFCGKLKWDAVSLLNDLTSVNPKRRPSAESILRHPVILRHCSHFVGPLQGDNMSVVAVSEWMGVAKSERCFPQLRCTAEELHALKNNSIQRGIHEATARLQKEWDDETLVSGGLEPTRRSDPARTGPPRTLVHGNDATVSGGAKECKVLQTALCSTSQSLTGEALSLAFKGLVDFFVHGEGGLTDEERSILCCNESG